MDKNSRVSFFGSESKGGSFIGKGQVEVNPIPGTGVSFDNGQQNKTTFEQGSTLHIGGKLQETQEEVKKEEAEEDDQNLLASLC